MIQCQGCTCAGWLWEGEGGLGDHQPGVYVPLKALFLVSMDSMDSVHGLCPLSPQTKSMDSMEKIHGHTGKNLWIFSMDSLEIVHCFCFMVFLQMGKMAAMPIYGKYPSKIFFSRTGGPISKELGM